MRPLRKFIALSGRDRSLLLEAMLLVWGIRIALWLLPFRSVQRLLSRFDREAQPVDAPAADRIAWAVGAASRRAPKATCLTQALAVTALCRRHDIPAAVRIGVAKDPSGAFVAHAWVESLGRVIIGGSDLDRYVKLPLPRPWSG